MLRKDTGVVLRTSRSGETSRMVTFLGRSLGKVRLIGKGAMSSKSPFRGALEPGNRVEIVFYYKEGRTLYFIKEVHVAGTLSAQTGPLDRVAANLAALELLDHVCYWGGAEERIVGLAEAYLACRTQADPLSIYLAFELQLLEVLGALPHLDACADCGAPASGGFYYPAEGSSRCGTHAVSAPHRVRVDEALVQLATRMCHVTFDEVGENTVDVVSRKRLGKLLHWTYTHHVQGYSLPESFKLIPRTRHH